MTLKADAKYPKVTKKNLDDALINITEELQKAVQTRGVQKSYNMTKMAEDVETEPVIPGLEVAIHHQLAPVRMNINIGGVDPKKAYHWEDDKGYKFAFHYLYLDLPFTIRTDDDKVAGKLCPFFNEEQRKQIMAIVLGGREEIDKKEEKDCE